MKYKIDAVENAKTGMKWKDLGVQATLARAYLYSKAAGNELPNFADVIWEEDIEAICKDCRKYGVKEFTISSTFSNLIETIAKFEELGYMLDGLVKIRERSTYFGSEEYASIPAFKMTMKGA